MNKAEAPSRAGFQIDEHIQDISDPSVVLGCTSLWSSSHFHPYVFELLQPLRPNCLPCCVLIVAVAVAGPSAEFCSFR